MPSTFVNPTISNAPQLGLGFATDSEPVSLVPGSPASDIEAAIRAIYRQILGNAHVMESERPIALESPFQQGELSVREFVRCLAQSELYRSRFFDNCPRYRAIELNFKHLLGRAPESYAEMTAHSDILDRGGFTAEIDSYLDSQEYLTAFGENTVPYYRGYKTQLGRPAVGFSHLFELFQGAASSDNASVKGARPRLTTALVAGIPSRIPSPASRAPRTGSPTIATAPEFPADPAKFTSYASQMGLGLTSDSEPISLVPGDSASDIEVALRAIYRQVLGNAHVMESERPIALESPFQQGELSVREFVRRLAQSELYRARFFDNCPRYRAIELNFKHLLGRAPESYAEMAAHSDILDRLGFAAEIDSYIDSDEYFAAFGDDTVPYYRGHKTQTGRQAVGFTYLFELFQGAASSDKASVKGTRPHLTTALVKALPSRTPLRSSSQATDARALLAELFKTAPATPMETAAGSVASTGLIPPSLKQQCQERAEKVAALEKKLADLGPRASIGQASLSSWQSTTASEDSTAMTLSERAALQAWQKPYPQPSDLTRCAAAQEKVIAYLEQKIADGERYAFFGDRQLNKWRKS